MVEVFITNVKNQEQAKLIIQTLEQVWPNYKINFDLEDCDNILRVENQSGEIDNELLIYLVQEIGFLAIPLPDTVDEMVMVDSI